MNTNASRLHDVDNSTQESDFNDLETNRDFSSAGEDLTLNGKEFSSEGEDLTSSRNFLPENDDSTPRGKELKEDQGTILDKTKLGTYLRQTREQQGLSLQQVADRLFLNTHFLRAIENDDYGSLPSAVFVRGYLKNYAKLLGLSTETVLEAYDVIGQDRAPHLSPQLSQKEQVSTNDSGFKILTGIIIVALMVLVTLWNIYPNSSDSRDELAVPSEALPESFELETIPSAERDNEGTDSISAAKGAVRDAGQMVVHFKKEAWLKITDHENNKLYEGTGEAGKELPIVGIPPFKISAGNTDIAIEYQGEIVDLAGYKRIEEGFYVFGEVGAEKTETAEQVVKNSPLIVRFKQRTWLRVTDGNDKTLYEGIKKAGEDLTVNGTPPFKIKTGHEAGVEVEYGSKTVDLRDHTEKEGRLFIFGK